MQKRSFQAKKRDYTAGKHVNLSGFVLLLSNMVKYAKIRR